MISGNELQVVEERVTCPLARLSKRGLLQLYVRKYRQFWLCVATQHSPTWYRKLYLKFIKYDYKIYKITQ